MKILVLNYEYPPLGGGGGMACKDISEMLSLHGNSVDVVTMAYENLPEKEYREGVNIYRVKCWRTQKRVCHPWEQITYCIAAYYYIIRRLDIREYDVVHCHFIVPTGLLALWLKKHFGIKYVITAHGSDVLGHNNLRFKWIYRLIKPLWSEILEKASAITAPSDYLIEKIYDSYRGKKCINIPNGLHMEQYIKKEKKKSIITLERLQKSKGIQDLINACAKMDLGEWEVHILGDGPYRKELEALVENNNLENKIFFEGYVGNEGGKKFGYLGEAGIYFTGSWFEAFHVSVLEAMASGCAIIASDIEPHRQLLPEECIYGSEDELIEKLKKNMDMTLEKHIYAMDEYDWTNIVSKYETVFNDIAFM